MPNLNYGDGNCSIEGDIRAIQIEFTGLVEITDKTGNNFIITAKNNRLIIYPIGTGLLTDLFEYVGEFKIVSVKAVDSNAELISVSINHHNDYIEFSYTNAEDATINIEDMNSTYTNQRKVPNTLVHPTEKENQLMADEYLGKTKQIIDESVETTTTPQISSISTGTSY